MLTLTEIKNTLREMIHYAHPEDIDGAADELLQMMNRAQKQQPKLVNNDDETK